MDFCGFFVEITSKTIMKMCAKFNFVMNLFQVIMTVDLTTSSMRFNICCEIWIKCRINVLKDLFPICCRARFFRPEKINFKFNEINRNTSIFFSLYNLQFTVVSYEMYKFWNQHDGGSFLLKAQPSRYISEIKKS